MIMSGWISCSQDVYKQKVLYGRDATGAGKACHIVQHITDVHLAQSSALGNVNLNRMHRDDHSTSSFTVTAFVLSSNVTTMR